MLTNYLPKKTFTVTASYKDNDIVPLIAAAEIQNDGSVRLMFPHKNPYQNHKTLTIHLDNRTGVEAFDADLRVYRCSYKGSIIESNETSALILPLDYEVIYSTNVIEHYQSPVFMYSEDDRQEHDLAETELEHMSIIDDNEHSNKLGILITKSVDQPHTTVMAFLSTKDDDIFLITEKGTRKSYNLHRNSECCFAIDHRSTYVFEKAYEWNYSIIRGQAFQVSKNNPLFGTIQRKFIEKNPWEIVFFSSPNIEMFHIKPIEVLCPDKL